MLIRPRLLIPIFVGCLGSGDGSSHAVARSTALGDIAKSAQPAIAEAAKPVVVPFTLYSGHIYVDVVIDGKGPFHFVFDTGAPNIMSPTTARQLGLTSGGNVEAKGTGGVQRAAMTKVATIRIGGATLRDQKIVILDLPSSASEGRSIDGLIGSEWLNRYPTRIDYAASTLTFYPPGGPHDTGTEQAIALRFRGRLPQIDASVDGLGGRFTIDTGSNGSLNLYPGFVERNGLVDRYRATTAVMSAVGVGGPVYSLVTRAGQLNVAGHIVKKPVTFLPKARTGTSADPQTAGNIGSGVLRRFTITLDYANARAWFQPNAGIGEPDLADRSGLRLDTVATGFKIAFVAADSAAALAGVRVGDVIIAIDGTPAAKVDLATLRSRLKGPVGTMVSIGLDSGRTVTMTLRDID